MCLMVKHFLSASRLLICMIKSIILFSTCLDAGRMCLMVKHFLLVPRLLICMIKYRKLFVQTS